MRERTYTVAVTGAGAVAGRFERALDVLSDAAMVGDDETPTVALYFDVEAPDADVAVERAFLRVRGLLRRDEEVTFSVVPASTVEGRLPWWQRLLRRR